MNLLISSLQAIEIYYNEIECTLFSRGPFFNVAWLETAAFIVTEAFTTES